MQIFFGVFFFVIGLDAARLSYFTSIIDAIVVVHQAIAKVGFNELPVTVEG